MQAEARKTFVAFASATLIVMFGLSVASWIVAAPVAASPGRVYVKEAKARAIVRPGMMIRGEQVSWGCTVTNGGIFLTDDWRFAALVVGDCFGKEGRDKTGPVFGEFGTPEPIGSVMYTGLVSGVRYSIVVLDSDVGMYVASRTTGELRRNEQVCAATRFGHRCGVVAGLRDRRILATVPALPGDSGAPLFNSRGEPVAVLVGAHNDEAWLRNSGFGLASEYVVMKTVLDDAYRQTAFCTAIEDCLG